MNAVPAITVLIAAYNAAEFLHRSVESALAQTLPPLEVLIVDDASTDLTVEAANRLSTQDKRVRVITLPQNAGPSSARNAGFDAARGDWIAVLDADDAYQPDYLKLLLKTAESFKADVVLGNFSYFEIGSGALSPSGISLDGLVDRYDFVANARPYTGQSDWGVLKPMFSRRFMNDKKLRYPTFSRHGEDFLLMMEVFLSGAVIAICDAPEYLYTHRSSGLSRTQIDYHTMWRHSRALLADPRVRHDSRLKDLLLKRVRAVRRLAAERRFEQLRRQRDYAGLLRMMFTDASFTGALLAWAREKYSARR